MLAMKRIIANDANVLAHWSAREPNFFETLMLHFHMLRHPVPN